MGYITTRREEQINAAGLNVEAKISILDCQGSVFHQGIGTYTERRDQTMTRDGQLDAAQSKAVKAVVEKVLDFKNSHEAEWDRFVRTGSADAASSPAPKTPSPPASGASG